MNSLTLKHTLFCVGLTLLLSHSTLGKNINLATDNDIVNTNKLSEAPEPSGFTVGNEIKVLYKLYEQCRLNNKDLVLCLKLKLVNAIDKLNSNRNIEVLRGIYLVKENGEETPSNGTVDEQRSASSVDNVINEKIFDFFKSRSLSLKLFELDNQGTEDADNQVSERKKKDKGSQWMMWPFLMGGMMIPLSFMALALLAGKALILAKLALALSAIIGLKKLGGSHGSTSAASHDSYQVVSHGAGTHYRRSLPLDDLQAQNLAYRAYLADVTELSSPDKTE